MMTKSGSSDIVSIYKGPCLSYDEKFSFHVSICLGKVANQFSQFLFLLSQRRWAQHILQR